MQISQSLQDVFQVSIIFLIGSRMSEIQAGRIHMVRFGHIYWSNP